MSDELVVVQFSAPWKMYNPGEKAGFYEKTTKLLVKAGVAQLVEDPATKEMTAPVRRRRRGMPQGDQIDAETAATAPERAEQESPGM